MMSRTVAMAFAICLAAVSAVAQAPPANLKVGVIVTLSAVVRHFQLVRELRSGTWRAGRVSTDAVILGLVLAALGIAMALYLTLVR